MSNLVDKAKEIAEEAHKGHVRKFNNEPYINHPLRVCESISYMDDDIKAAALLHDVIEDTNITESDLRNDFPEEVVNVVKILTRLIGETYFDYILRIAKSRNTKAVTIKLADLNDNISDLEEGSLKDKYRLARYVIQNFDYSDIEWK